MKTMYENPWFRVEKEGVMHRIVNAAPFGVVIVTLNRLHGTVLVGRHPRFATGDAASLELPRGNARQGETPCDAAARELGEETGVVTDDLTFRDIGILHADTGLVCDEIHVVVVESPFSPNEAHDAEFTTLQWMKPDDVTARSSDALTLASLAKARLDLQKD